MENAYHVYEKQKKFQSRKDTTKVNTKKKRDWGVNVTFGVHYKASNVIRWFKDWLFIKERWICIMTYVKKSLNFEVNKVIYRFLYKDNNRKELMNNGCWS